MRASVCEVREIIRHTLAVIEQSRIIVREVDDRWHTLAAAWNPSNLASSYPQVMTAKDELKALVAKCLEKNDTYRAMEEFKKIVSKRPDLLEVVERQFDHVLLVNPDLLSINDPPDKLPQG
jgi:hypothetical protein